MSPALQRALGVAVAALALLALPAAASAAVAPPYVIQATAANSLKVLPAMPGSTLAVVVQHTGPSIEFIPAAATAPAGCTSTLTSTTCAPSLMSTQLWLTADVLEVDVSGVSTTTLELDGGAENDSIEVHAPVAPDPPVGTIVLNPGAGDDSVVISGDVGAISQPLADPGDDRFQIDSTGLATGTLSLGDGNDVASSKSPNLTLDGGPGSDTLSGAGPLSGGTGNDILKPTALGKLDAGGDDVDRLSFDLMPAAVALTKTATDVQVAGDVVTKTGIEEVDGSNFADTLTGSGGPDTLLGGDGDDTIDGRGGGDILDGGTGFDTVSYASAAGSVVVDLGAGTGAAASGGAVDTLTSFRGVITGAGNDTVTGTSADERFDTGAGDDTINAGAGNDTLLGGAGNDLLRGGEGADTIDGGAGTDTDTYDDRTSGEPVTVTLMTPGDDGAAGENDTIVGVENLTGGAGGDTLVGDDGPNTIIGGPGLNTMSGLGGDDVIEGGDNRDVITGGPGHDQLFGGDDSDSIDAFDGGPDVVDCGPTLDDDAQVDASDTVTGCEYSRRGDVPVPVDADGDGFVAGFDCNDSNPAIHPGATDIVGDGIDQDCDGFDQPVPYVDFGLTRGFNPTAKGTIVVKLLLTKLAKGQQVVVTCKTTKKHKRGCPFTKLTRKPTGSGQIGLTALFKKHPLPAGTTLDLQITQPKFNGKVRRFVTRNLVQPTERTLCLTAPKRTPQKCPADEDD